MEEIIHLKKGKNLLVSLKVLSSTAGRTAVLGFNPLKNSKHIKT
ncbi:hypothetical protein [Bacillus massiliigorillae]|nr:hypothetical protein [Bacillus massiliigorillae]